MTLARATRGETPDLADNISDMIRADRLELNTCMPAVIISYDPSTKTCEVTPSFSRRFIDPTLGDEGVVPRMDISGVPVVFPQSSSGGVTFPLSKGDPVMLLFAQRDIDTWIEKGGEDAPASARLHDITDAIAIPGLFSFPDIAKAATPPPTDKASLFGSKIFVGDPSQSTTAVSIPAADPATPGILPASGATLVTAQPLDLTAILSIFIQLMTNCVYSGVANTGGGGLDPKTALALTGLLSDLEKLQ